MNTLTSPTGLIHSLLLDGTGGARALTWQEVTDWSAEQGCLWLHFNFEDEEVQHWLSRESRLNDIAYNGLTALETRPRAVSRGGNLLLALRGINLTPGAQPEDMISIRIWTDGSRVISTRRRSLLSTEDVVDRLEDGSGPLNAATLLVEWIDRVIGRMNETVDELEDDVSELENKVLSGQIEGVRLELAQKRKQCISIRRWLAPQREALSRLYNEQLPWLDELNRLRIREVADRQIRHVEDIDEVRERAAMAQEELLGRVSEQMNQRSYLFTVVATIFLPLGFFTGLMGINVGGMPGVEDGMGFWIVVVLCIGLMLTLGALFRWKKWL